MAQKPYFTSTPGTSTDSNIRFVISNVDSITNPNLQSSSSSSVTSSTDDQLSTATLTTDEEIVMRNVAKGKEYELLKPIKDHGIYWSLLSESNTVNNIALAWLNSFAEQPDSAIKSLIQFITDICGYQKINIDTMYALNGANVPEIIREMEQNRPEAIKLNKYLLNSHIKWSKKACVLISDFFYTILEQNNARESLYDEKFLEEVIIYLKKLSSSKVVTLKHTAVVIATKFITGLAKVHGSLHRETTDNNYIKNRIKALLEIVTSNCMLQVKDDLLNNMKISCAQELCKWYNSDLKMFIEDRSCESWLVDYIKDYCTNVCAAGMTALNKIVKIIPDDHLDRFLPNFVPHIKDLLQDESNIIVIDAIHFFAYVLHSKKINYLDRTVYDIMVLFLFHKRFPIARAAGHFIAYFIYTCRDINSPREIYCYLIRILESSEKFKNLTGLLVESLIDPIIELTQWEMMLSVLYESDLTHGAKICLLKIMCCSMHMCITGKLSKLRDHDTTSIGPKIPTDKKYTIPDLYFQNFKKLIQLYSDSFESIVQLIDLLDVIDCISSPVRDEHFTNVLLGLEFVFYNITNKEVEESVYKLLHTYTTKLNNNMVNNFVNAFKTQLTEAYGNVFEEYSKNYPSEETFNFIKNTLVAINLFYKYFNLIEIDWEKLYVKWEQADRNFVDHYIEYHVANWCHYLKWQLRDLLSNDDEHAELQHAICSLNQKCDQVNTACFKILSNNMQPNAKVQAFRCIADLFINFNIELEETVESKPSFKHITLKITDNDKQECLKCFVETYIFGEMETHDIKQAEKSLDLQRIINMMNLHIVPHYDMIYVLKYLYSHKNKYETVFNMQLKNMQESNMPDSCMIISQTLIDCYTQFSTSDMNMTSPEAKNLHHLVNCFKPHLKSETAFQILRFGVVHALTDGSNADYLFFLEGLIKLLNKERRNELKRIVSVEKDFHKVPVVKKFLMKLK